MAPRGLRPAHHLGRTPDAPATHAQLMLGAEMNKTDLIDHITAHVDISKATLAG
ncbi:hypothetical protein SAMN04487769_1462 [Burkholderia sp. b14]|nr:hypothetical protein SAMN04487769_1462 [Burkholderia sp. b14]